MEVTIWVEAYSDLGIAKSILWSAARQMAVGSQRRGFVVAALSKESDGVCRWQTMGIAWPGEAGRNGWETRRDARTGGRRVVRSVF